MEKWKPIDWIPNIRKDQYLVSSYGRVKSLYDVKNPFGRGERRYYREVIMSPHVSRGYLVQSLTIVGKPHGRTFRVNRLVAQAFKPNPLSKPEVNHIDGNKLNNREDNLEWVTTHENAVHKCNTLNKNKHTAKRVECLTTGKTYSSINEAELDTGIDHSWISRACRTGCKTKGMKWRYV